MIQKDKIKEWINIFLEHIDNVSSEYHVKEEEGYKFKAVDIFQNNFNIDAPDLSSMIDRSIETNNLVAGSFYFPKKMLEIFAEEYEEETKKALKELFNEDKSVVDRINNTQDIFDEIMSSRNERLNDDSNHFIGLRFLSLLLGYRFPEKYNPLKPREWKLFCKFVDDDFKIPMNTSPGDQYEIYNDYIEELKSEIKNRQRIVDLKDQLTRGLSFNDEKFVWMTQNIIYVTASELAKSKSEEEYEGIEEGDDDVISSVNNVGNMEFPLEKYLEDFIVRNWDSIDFGEELKLYIDEEGVPAQQYPTFEGYIDILAKDKDDNFVVIELKKSRSDQKVVGQILSYVGWVKRNLSENGKVRGVIIVADSNNALMDAVSTVSDFISIKHYKVDFSFNDPKSDD